MSNEQVIIDREAPPWAQRLQTDLNGVFTRITRRAATVQAGGFVTPDQHGGSVQAAIDAAATGSRLVLLGAQTYTLSATLNMRPGVHVLGVTGTVLYRNLTAAGYIVDFAAHTAHGAILENVTVDGGGGQGSGVAVDPLFLIHNNGADDIQVIGCTLKNSNGHGFYMYAGVRPRIENNTVHNINLIGISLQPATQINTNASIRGNVIYDVGYHPLQLYRTNYNIISENRITGNLTAGYVVDTSGTTVTWVSGPDFSALRTNTYMIYNGGLEAFIVSIQSATQLTLLNSAGVLNDVPASFGTGDMVSIIGSSNNLIMGNYMHSGAGGHVVLTDTGAHPGNNNLVYGNHSFDVGSSGYSVQPIDSNQTQWNSIIGNHCADPGRNGTAGAPLFNCGIYNAEGKWTHVADNTIVNRGANTLSYGIVSAGTLVHQMILGDNCVISPTVEAIHRAVVSITAGAGWGATATVTNIVQNAKSVRFRITANGAGLAAFPAVTVSTSASQSGTNSPQPIATMHRNATGLMYAVRFTGGDYTGIGLDVPGFTPTAAEVHDFTVHF